MHARGLPAHALHVFGVGASKDQGTLVFLATQFQDSIRQAAQELAVMGHEEHGALGGSFVR